MSDAVSEPVGVESLPQPNIEFTMAAARKVWQLMAEDQQFDQHLRVSIMGGGCSGFQYIFKFDDTIHADDTVIKRTLEPTREPTTAEPPVHATAATAEHNHVGEPSAPVREVQLLIDSLSYPYLEGATIDFKDDLEGACFVISNPRAKSTCGCGASFSLADEAVSGDETDTAG